MIYYSVGKCLSRIRVNYAYNYQEDIIICQCFAAVYL
jgi:hypothetical protein